MGVEAVWTQASNQLSTASTTQLCLSAILLLVLLPVLTYLWTSLRFKFWQWTHARILAGKPGHQYRPPRLPYSLPFIGHATGFFVPGKSIWTNIMAQVPRCVGAATMLLGGDAAYVLFSPHAINTLFKERGLLSMNLRNKALRIGFGMPDADYRKFYCLDTVGPEASMDEQVKIAGATMLRAEPCNELTAEFVRKLAHELQAGPDVVEGGLFDWLRPNMFKASVKAFYGTRLLEVYPSFHQDFSIHDKYFSMMFFGLPRLLIPKAFAARDSVLDGLEKYTKTADQESKGVVTEPLGPVKWDALWGSRAHRARQELYLNRKMSERGRASESFGIAFALNNNAIPCVAWTLFHILNPNATEPLYPRVMAELREAQKPDGELDIPILVSRPLIQSIMQEVLRMYVDTIVLRDVKHDMTLPIDERGSVAKLKRGGMIFSPTYIGHYHSDYWTDPNVFNAERFLREDPATGKTTFTLDGTAGKFFPWGGGKTMCPGRAFAKQEVIAAVALILLTYDIEVMGFVDERGNAINHVPGFKHVVPGVGVIPPGGELLVKMKRRAKVIS